MNKMRDSLANLPKVDLLLKNEQISGWAPIISRTFVKMSVNRVLDEIRRKTSRDNAPLPEESVIVDRIDRECRKVSRQRLQRALNGTGVLLHTNLGRVPVGRKLWRQAEKINTGYCNLEMDLTDGKRNERFPFVLRLTESLTGAEKALLVNNNAAGVFLMLSVFAQGKEVIVSRGEMVQIGGGFRIPEILEQSGARLVEVGTTNITTIEDYRRALSENTKMILVVNPSNYRINGFTSSPSIKELRTLTPPEVLLAVDEGCCQLVSHSPQDKTVGSCLRQGVDLVTFSADKLLGGVQGGFVVGKRELIDAMSRHPQMRLLRVGKTIASLLEARLLELVDRQDASLKVRPFNDKELAAMKRRGVGILKKVNSAALRLEPSFCAIGGGSHPGEEHPSWALVFDENHDSPGKILKDLRDATPPLIGRVQNDRACIDLAAIGEEDQADLIRILKKITVTGE